MLILTGAFGLNLPPRSIRASDVSRVVSGAPGIKD